MWTGAQRGHGIGQMLLASAARTGQQFGRSKVTLAAQDKGNGHLTRWYKGMGFTQTGVNQRGFPQLEAPISRVLAGAVQRRETQNARPDPVQLSRTMPGAAQRRIKPPHASRLRSPHPHSPRAPRFAQVVQRMDSPIKTTAGHAEDFVILKNGLWLVKKVDKPEGEQYERWARSGKPAMVPDFYGPFDDNFDIFRI